jgi:hypothetical protein
MIARCSVSNLASNLAPKIKGQALIELLVVMLALIPLFIIIPMLAKYQDISHATQIASRYAAFAAEARSRTLNTPARRRFLADNIRRRIFSNSEAPIKTNDVAGDFDEHRNLFWRTPTHTALIDNFGNDIQISFGTPGRRSSFSPASDGLPFTLKDSLQLPAQGIYTVNVSVSLANIGGRLRSLESFNQLNLSMTRSTSLLLNAWTAWSPTNLETHFENQAIVPANNLAALSTTVNPTIASIEHPGNLSGPKLGQLDFWRDVVPADRLKSQ